MRWSVLPETLWGESGAFSFRFLCSLSDRLVGGHDLAPFLHSTFATRCCRIVYFLLHPSSHRKGKEKSLLVTKKTKKKVREREEKKKVSSFGDQMRRGDIRNFEEENEGLV